VSGTIGELLAAACQRYRGRLALVRGGKTRSYGELLDHGARVANALRGAGLAPGTPMAAMLEDRIASPEVYVGAAFGGYPVIHIHDRLAAPEVAHILADSGAHVLFHTDGRSEVVAAAAAQAELRLLVTIGAERPAGSMGFDELVTSARSALQITPIADGDLAIVGYTSGTTGLPKGAISQRALTDCVRLSQRTCIRSSQSSTLVRRRPGCMCRSWSR
jgi:fatty-acyl-CoA synthase